MCLHKCFRRKYLRIVVRHWCVQQVSQRTVYERGQFFFFLIRTWCLPPVNMNGRHATGPSVCFNNSASEWSLLATMAACFSNRINLFPLRSLYPHLLIGYKMIGAETNSKTSSQSGVTACAIWIVILFAPSIHWLFGYNPPFTFSCAAVMVGFS